LFSLQGELPAASNLTIDPVVFHQNNLVAALIYVFVDVEPGSRSRLDFILDYGRDGTVNGDDYPLFTYFITEGQQLKVSDLAYPNVPGDFDNTQDGHLSAFVVIGMNNQYVVPFVVRIDDGNGAAQAVLEALTVSPGYDVSGKVVRDADPGLGTPSLVFIDYVHELIQYRSIVATDEAGNFSTTVPWGGSYMVYAQAPGMVATVADGGGMSITRQTGSPTPPVNLNLTATGLREIRGRVEGPGGQGIPFASVYAVDLDPSGTSEYPLALSMGIADETGGYTVPVVDGKWSLVAPGLHVRGFVEDDEDIGLEDIAVSGSDVTGQTIVAKHPIESLVTRRLFRGDTNPPAVLPGVTGLVYREEAGGEEWWFDAKGTSNQGRFILGAFGGEWTFEVVESNFPVGANLAPPLPRIVTVTTGEVLDLGDIYLYPGYDRVQHLILNGKEHRNEAGDDIGPKEMLRTIEEWARLARRKVSRNDFLELIRGD
jgi:hypothetical protein